MKASPEQLNQMERYMMKLLMGIIVVTAIASSVPLYMLHEADTRARMAAAPASQPENTPVVR